MRSLKFRAWDKNIMYYNVMVGNPPVNPSVYVEGRGWLECTEDAVIMQYTGLRDVDGKEIYEGDIVNAYVDYGPAGAIKITYAVGIDGSGNNLERWTFEEEGYLPKVIGNVHEHPELLEGSQC